MTAGFFILTILLIALFGGIIYALKWALDNEAEFSENPKIQKIVVVAIKVILVVFSVLLIYVVFETLIILVSPLFDQLNDAFNVATSKIFAFFDQLIPWVVLGGIGYWYWKNRTSQKSDTAKEPISFEVAVELARQRGVELQKYALALLFRIIVATRSVTNAIPPNDEKGIAISSDNRQSFYMDKDVVIYQAIVPIDGEITNEVEDDIRDELQDAVSKYIDEFPDLIDPTRNGYPPVEILTVRGVGRKVIIDAVIASKKTIPLIDARRTARIERRNRQDHEGDAGDPLFR